MSFDSISGGFVFDFGGVVCMQLLVKQHWIPSYTLEAVILEVAATLTRGGGRVIFGASNDEFSLEKAQRAFEHLNLIPDSMRKSNTSLLNKNEINICVFQTGPQHQNKDKQKHNFCHPEIEN